MIERKLAYGSALGRPVVLLTVLVLLTFLVGCAVASPTRTADISSSNEGVPIADEFKAFYLENGGLRVFGFPLAEAYLDNDSQRLIQYFQQLRLEYDGLEDQVVVTPLGQWALSEQTGLVSEQLTGKLPPSQADDGELRVEGAFLTFYENFGGESVFGRPISDQLDEGGNRMQYFENARLDWRPEAPIEYRIQPGRLGEAHYRLVGLFKDPGRSRPLSSAGVREADVSATLRAPVLYDGEEQIVYVDVKTPEGQRPVAGVSVVATVYYNNDSVRSFDLVETDGTGHTHGTLNLNDLLPGQKVRVMVEASTPGGAVIGATSKSFKSWW